MYTYSKKTCDAFFPRSYPAATIHPNDTLKLVYNHYTRTSKPKNSGKKVNFVLIHGNGMNKAIWCDLVDRLYSHEGFDTNHIVCFDAVNHCDSAVANSHKLGITFDWRDNGHDILAIVKKEYNSLYLDGDRLILIGHSFGGFGSLWAASICPGVFDSVIAVDPVIFDYFPNPKKSKQISMKKYRVWSKKLKDSFASKQEARDYFFHYSHWTTMDHAIVESMFNDEIIYKEKTGKWGFKTSVDQQMVTYSGHSSSISSFRQIIDNILNPTHFIIGSKSGIFDLEAFKKTIAVKREVTYDVLEGGHVIHGENPLAVAKSVLLFVDNRCKSASEKETFKQWQLQVKNKLLTDNERQDIFNSWNYQVKNGGYSIPGFVPKL